MKRAVYLFCGIAISANAFGQTPEDPAAHVVREFDRANSVLRCYFLARIADAPAQDNYLLEGMNMTKRAFREASELGNGFGNSICDGDASCSLILESGGIDVMVGIMIQQASNAVEFQKNEEIKEKIKKVENLDLALWAQIQLRTSNCEFLLP
ncbi:MAG TPA: hypothetical protein VLA52_14295 [Thermohalobaculum sp.]|nr:hypothetical protein [Thermohalobaculum sp.]